MTEGLGCTTGGLRVAHLIETSGPGGAERIVADLASTLQQAGAGNVVLLRAGGEGWLERELERSGVAIERVDIDGPVSLQCARLIAEAFRRHRVAIAHSHEFGMAVYGAWATRFAGIPHVITMHGGRYYAHRLRRRLALRVAVELSARTVAVSTSVARALKRDLWLQGSRIQTIPNGVRYVPPAHSTLREELRIDSDDRLLLSIGNLYPVKGHQHLIDALALLAGRHPNLHLAVAGRGELADALAERARDHGLGDRVHLLGLRSDVTGLLAAADVFVLPSLSEGLPLALLEAMFAARPIVASNVGEVASALAGGDAGILVEPGEPHALAEAVDHLLKEPERARALSTRAARRAHAEYSLSRMVGRYLNVYEELTGRRSIPRRTLPAAQPRSRRSLSAS